MFYRRKFYIAVGPLILAIFLFICILFSPISFYPVDQEKIQYSATSISTNIMKGEKLYQTAMQEEAMIPFFGSSELSRFDAFHPSVIAEKYDREYTPYLIGNAGSQSLTHYLVMEGMGNTLKNKKAVFIISPQWFSKQGASPMMFGAHFSPLQAYKFILSGEKDSLKRRYIAERLLSYPIISDDKRLSEILLRITEGESITEIQNFYANSKLFIYEKEDSLFGSIITKKQYNLVMEKTTLLPSVYNSHTLDIQAFNTGEKDSRNNKFQIKNEFYNTRIKPIEIELKGSQKKISYEISPEYSDFQLVLMRMKEQNMDVRFVIPPVNHKWLEYTGLSQATLDNFSKKIDYQLTSQGFSIWLAYILTRPLGASLGDYLSQPVDKGGLNLGTVGTSGLFLALIFIIVVYLTVTKKDSIEMRK